MLLGNRILKFYSSIKIEMKQGELVVSKLTINEEEGIGIFKKVRFRYKGKLPIIIIEVKGMFETYTNSFNGENLYYLAINVKEAKFSFAELEERLAELACE